MPGNGTSSGGGLGGKTLPEPQGMNAGRKDVEAIASCDCTKSVVEGTFSTAEDS